MISVLFVLAAVQAPGMVAVSPRVIHNKALDCLNLPSVTAKTFDINEVVAFAHAKYTSDEDRKDFLRYCAVAEIGLINGSDIAAGKKMTVEDVPLGEPGGPLYQSMQRARLCLRDNLERRENHISNWLESYFAAKKVPLDEQEYTSRICTAYQVGFDKPFSTKR